ncbi:MAG: hypothetical protein SFX73_08900 [Kofleriaceae bacterium]|nr:hypothetical protein [Kofleriaceae bacterium]
MQATDTSAIQRLIGRARFRIRSQWALEGATTASILAAVTAMVSVFAMRIELVTPSTGVGMLIAAGAIIVAGAVVSASRRIDDETVARRIDRASNLSDRLSTAIAFQRALGSNPAADETDDLMIAAIKDGVRAVPRANIIAAAPFTKPRDLNAAAGFFAVSALVAGLFIERPDRTPSLGYADPAVARPGEIVHLRGKNLLTGVASPVASLDVTRAIGAPGVAPKKQEPVRGFVPADASVYLGADAAGRPVPVIDWAKDTITIRIPEDAPIGITELTAYIGKKQLGPVPFEVISLTDERGRKEGSVEFPPDEKAYIESIIGQLKDAAKRDNVPELEEFAKKIEQLLKDAEEGKITKEQLLDALAKAEEELSKNSEPNQAEIDKAMQEMGKELAKENLTKELGQALEKNDLQKAKEELEKLADKLDPEEAKKQLEELKKQLENKELTPQQKQDLQKQMEELKKQLENKNLSEQQKQDLQKQMEELKKQLENKNLSEQEKQELQKKIEQLEQNKTLSEQEKQKLQEKLEQVSKQMQQKEQDKQQKTQQQQQKLQDEIKRLEKKKEQAKNEKEQLEAERQLQKKKDELQKLQKDEQDKEDSAQRQALKRLQKDIEKAAENLDKPQKDPNKSQEEQDEEAKERQKQASRNLKDAARETGRVDQDQRKQAQQKKMSSQMDDLREAMRRAKQKGNKGPNDPFNKNGKNQDFAQRARGQKGQGGQSWKPGQGGQGQGKGQGQGQPGGQGQQPGGSAPGTGHDDNLAGDPTGKSGNTKDQDLQGTQSSSGTSRRETILAAAQKGFASVGYQKVYADYQRIVEEVMRTEKLPSSYKYYVKRYFAKIHPSTAPVSEPAPAPQDKP